MIASWTPDKGPPEVSRSLAASSPAGWSPRLFIALLLVETLFSLLLLAQAICARVRALIHILHLHAHRFGSTHLQLRPTQSQLLRVFHRLVTGTRAHRKFPAEVVSLCGDYALQVKGFHTSSRVAFVLYTYFFFCHLSTFLLFHSVYSNRYEYRSINFGIVASI